MIRFHSVLLFSLLLPVAATAQQELAAPAASGSTVVFRPARADLTVTGWDRDSVQIVSRESGDIRIELERGAAGIQIHERRATADVQTVPRYQLFVPRNVVLRVSMQSGEIKLQDVDGDIRAGLVDGAIEADAVAGQVNLSTVTGPVRVDGSRGSLQARSVAGGMSFVDISGSIRVRSTSGNIRITRQGAGPVEAETYSGGLVFEGGLGDGPSSFATHSGSIDLHLPANAGATFFISAVEGRARIRCDGGSVEPEPGQPVHVGRGGDPVEVLTFTGNVRVTCGGSD